MYVFFLSRFWKGGKETARKEKPLIVQRQTQSEKADKGNNFVFNSNPFYRTHRWACESTARVINLPGARQMVLVSQYG